MAELIPVGGCDNEKRAGDVIFVHGLNGMRADTGATATIRATTGQVGSARTSPASGSGP